jgi:hypothetical protein
MLHLLAIGGEISVVAELAGSLAGATARGDGARGTESVGEVIEDPARAVSRSYATASEENVFVVSGVRGAADGIGFSEGVTCDRAPVELGDRACSFKCPGFSK